MRRHTGRQTGTTGAGAKRLDTDAYYMGIAIAVREKADCRGNRVGAVLVKENRVISTGYNGVPEGMTNCLKGGCLRCRNPYGRFPPGTGYDLCICVHAEQNALLTAARFGISVQGATLYTTMQPCFGCAKELLQAHVRRIIYLHPWSPSDADPRMDGRKKAEFRRMTTRFETKRLALADPRAEWAVSALRAQTRESLGRPSPTRSRRLGSRAGKPRTS